MSEAFEPKIVQKAPYKVDVEKGKKYFWCACGLSQKQPFCDGSHSGTGIKSLVYTAESNKSVYFCGCKKTNNSPLCDGVHKEL